MQLSEEEVRGISRGYDLGDVTLVEPIREGIVNHNFIFHTNQTRYVVQFLGKNLSEKRDLKMALTFETLDHLHNSGFKYKLPLPLRSLSGSKMSELEGKTFWIYEMLPGKSSSKMDSDMLKQFVQGLAIFHQKMSSFKKGNITPNISLEERLCAYNEVPIELENEVDVLWVANLPFFREMLIQSYNLFYGETSIIHGDYHPGNVLFEENHLVGMIDFSSVKNDFRVVDLAIMVDRTPIPSSDFSQKQAIFLDEYNLVSPLADEETELIIPALIRENCLLFQWFYNGKYKGQSSKHRLLAEVVKKTYALARQINWA